MADRKYWPVTEDDVYVRVFIEILDEVDHSFFDRRLIEEFHGLSVEAKHLVTRMYLRKHKWIRIGDLQNYLEISMLKNQVLPELISKKWILDQPPLNRLISDVATNKELLNVAKSLGLRSNKDDRAKLAEKLIQLERQQGLFNQGKTSTKISEGLPIEAYFLVADKHVFLANLQQMFLYPAGPDATLDLIFLSHMKKHRFLDYLYKKQKEAPVFQSKQDFEAYLTSQRICLPIEDAKNGTASKIPDVIVSSNSLSLLQSGLANAREKNYQLAFRVYARGFFNLSQVFMKAHRFQDEYNWIQKYLDQTFHKSKRGQALIRKLLLEIRFLEESGTTGESSWLLSAINTYYDAIAEVSDIERIDLERKTNKLLSGIKHTGLKSALSVITSASRPDLMKVEVPITQIVALPLEEQIKKVGKRLVYADGNDVERTALLNYTSYRGAHYENSIVTTILWFLCYDLLFGDPSRFRCRYQTFPMELQCSLDQNKAEIDKRLDNILDIVVKNRRGLVERFPDEPKPYIGGINWHIHEKDLVGILKGLGNTKTKQILLRILSNYFRYSSGFPDLTLWMDKPPYHTKFVEVKSENDTVSDNQLLWMKFLLEKGIDVEICKVVPQKRVPKRRRE